MLPASSSELISVIFLEKKYFYEVFQKLMGLFVISFLREVDPRVEAPDVAAVDLAQEDVLKAGGRVCNELKKYTFNFKKIVWETVSFF